MPTTHPLKRSVIAVSAALCMMYAATPSQAAVIGSFDPEFGPSIPNLGFRGTFQLTVDPSCYTGQTYVATGGSCTITMDTVTVNFYNFTDNPTGYEYQSPNGQYGDSGGFIDVETLDSSYFPSTYVTGAEFNPTNDELVAIDTNDSNPFSVYINQGSGNSSAPVYYNGQMLLYFVSNPDPTYLVDCTAANPHYDGEEEVPCSRKANLSSNPASVTIMPRSDPNAVPEPGSIPLALIGVGALATVLRKRRTSRRRDLA